MKKRTALVLGVLCGVLLVIMLIPTGTSAAAAKRSLSLTAPTSTTTGAVVTVRGVLSRTPKGSPVVIRRKSGTRWVKVVATRTATSSGAYVARFRAPTTGGTFQFRADAPRWRSAPQVLSVTRTVVTRVRIRASLSATPLSPAAGGPTSLAGAVAPWLAGTRVVLQRRVGTATTWSTLSVLTPDATGRFRTTTVPQAGVTTQFRVVVGSRGYRTSATSTTVAVKPAPEPSAAMDLRATSTGSHVALRWKNPVGTASVVVRYAEGANPPATPADGTAIPLSGVASTVTHTSAQYGVRYGYAVFVTTDDGRIIRATTLRPGPGLVSDVRTTMVPGKITFHWTNPAGVDHVIVEVIDGSGVPLPITPPPTPPGTNIGRATSHTVSGLTSRETIGILIYTVDAAGNYTGNVHSSAQSLDGTDIPPPPVSSPIAEATPSTVTLRWTNPGWAKVAIARADGSTPPVTPTAGWVVGTQPAREPVLDDAVLPGRTYTYALWAVESGNYSTPVQVTVRTPSGSPPAPVGELTATALAPTVEKGTTGHDPQRVRLRWTTPEGADAVDVSRARGTSAPNSPLVGGWNLLNPTNTLLDGSLAADTTYTYAVWAVGRDGSYSAVTTITVRSDPNTPRRVSGRVVDPLTGESVGAVAMSFRSDVSVHPTGHPTFTTNSGPDGSYAVDLPIGRYSACLDGRTAAGDSLHGYVYSCSELDVTSAATTRTDLEVHQGVTVTGLVTDDSSGAPLAGARVTVSRPFPDFHFAQSAFTDSSGRYTITGVSPIDSPHTVARVDPTTSTNGAPHGYEVLRWSSLVTDRAGETVRQDFRLTPVSSVVVSGRVTGLLGAPVAHVGVHVVDERGRTDGVPLAFTAADGTYTITKPLPSGESFGVCFDAERHQTAGAATGFSNQCHGGSDFDPEITPDGESSTFGVITPVAASETIDISLSRATVITGRVISADGAALVGATITANKQGRQIRRTTLTDADGRYSLTVGTSSAGATGIVVGVCANTDVASGGTSAGGYVSPPCAVRTVPSVTPIAGVDFVAQPAVIIRGTVRDSESAAPLAGLIVELREELYSSALRQAPSADDGSYVLRAVVPEPGETYRICTRGPDRPEVCSTLQELGVPSLAVGKTAHAAPLAVARQGSISGLLTGADTGEPLAGVRIVLSSPGDGGTPATTDEDGRYTFDGLRPGGHSLTVDANTKGPRGYHRISTGSGAITVSAGDDTVHDLAMRPASAVRVRVVGPDGRPAPGVGLDATGLDPYAQVYADAQGYATLKGLKPTTYPQGAVCAGRGTSDQGVIAGYTTGCGALPVLTDGQTATTTVVVGLDAYFGAHVIDAVTGEPLDFAIVELIGPDGSDDDGRTGESGFAFPGRDRVTSLLSGGHSSNPARPVFDLARICATPINYAALCFRGVAGDLGSGPYVRGRPGMVTIVPLAMSKE